VSDSLGARLRDAEVPDAADARERAWASVSAEFCVARPGAVRRARLGVAPGLAVAVAVGVLVLAVAAGATQPGAAVRGFVVRVLGGDAPPAPRAQLGPLPRGRMLVTSPRGAWIVGEDGSRSLLGAYTGAAWSPRGLYVAAWRGADLSAVAPDGRVAWTLRTRGPIADAAWSPDGYRVAYRRTSPRAGSSACGFPPETAPSRRPGRLVGGGWRWWRAGPPRGST
jgi:hypothetical protein